MSPPPRSASCRRSRRFATDTQTSGIPQTQLALGPRRQLPRADRQQDHRGRRPRQADRAAAKTVNWSATGENEPGTLVLRVHVTSQDQRWSPLSPTPTASSSRAHSPRRPASGSSPIDDARTPTSAISPNRALILGAGGVLAIVLAGCAALLAGNEAEAPAREQAAASLERRRQRWSRRSRPGRAGAHGGTDPRVVRPASSSRLSAGAQHVRRGAVLRWGSSNGEMGMGKMDVSTTVSSVKRSVRNGERLVKRTSEPVWRYGFNAGPTRDFRKRPPVLGDEARRVLADVDRDGLAVSNLADLTGDPTLLERLQEQAYAPRGRARKRSSTAAASGSPRAASAARRTRSS